MKNRYYEQLDASRLTEKNAISAYEISKIKDIIHRINVSIGDIIRGKRKAFNISIATLASVSHVSSTVITDLENARSLPKLEVLMKLATTLDIPFSMLFKEFKNESNFQLNSEKPEPKLEDMIKATGLSNIEAKDVVEYIEFKKYKKNKKK